MPIVIKAGKSDSVASLIRKFKRAIKAQDIVQKVRDRRYFKKPATIKAEALATKRHLKKKLRTLKKMKNVPEKSLEKLKEKISCS